MAVGNAVADVVGAGSAFSVATPDVARIDGFLRETFGESYIGGMTPSPEGLQAFAEKNPSVLTPEPLPIYLNPAVRE